MLSVLLEIKGNKETKQRKTINKVKSTPTFGVGAELRLPNRAWGGDDRLMGDFTVSGILTF